MWKRFDQRSLVSKKLSIQSSDTSLVNNTMSQDSWLEKIIQEYKTQNPSIKEEEINAVRELVSNADVKDKELRQTETTRHAQSLLKTFLNMDKENVDET